MSSYATFLYRMVSYRGIFCLARAEQENYTRIIGLHINISGWVKLGLYVYKEGQIMW